MGASVTPSTGAWTHWSRKVKVLPVPTTLVTEPVVVRRSLAPGAVAVAVVHLTMVAVVVPVTGQEVPPTGTVGPLVNALPGTVRTVPPLIGPEAGETVIPVPAYWKSCVFAAADAPPAP